jgi:hypothetical protein
LQVAQVAAAMSAVVVVLVVCITQAANRSQPIKQSPLVPAAQLQQMVIILKSVHLQRRLLAVRKQPQVVRVAVVVLEHQLVQEQAVKETPAVLEM